MHPPRPSALLSIACALLAAAPRPAAQAALDPVQRKLKSTGALPLAQQLADPSVQGWLQTYLRDAAEAHMDKLAGLSCRSLFSMGDRQKFRDAVGNGGKPLGPPGDLSSLEGKVWPAEYVNLVILKTFFEKTGEARPPRRLDKGVYNFPEDIYIAYYPPSSPQVNVYWHEVQHALLDAAGLSEPCAQWDSSLDKRGDKDRHHPFLEGVGNRGFEAFEKLLGFEKELLQARARRDYLASRGEYFKTFQGGPAVDLAQERHVWAACHRSFTGFLAAHARIARMPQARLNAYKAATGVFFAPPQAVANHYLNGGLRAAGSGPAVHPPKWVFYPDLAPVPVQIFLQDQTALVVPAQPPGRQHQAVLIRLSAMGSVVRAASGSAAQAKRYVAPGACGSRGIRLAGDEPEAYLRRESPDDAGRPAGRPLQGVALKSGASPRFFQVGMQDVPRGLLRLHFLHGKTDSLAGPTPFKVRLTFHDDTPERFFDTSETVAIFLVQPPAAAASTAGTGSGAPPAAALPPGPGTAVSMRLLDDRPDSFSATVEVTGLGGDFPPGSAEAAYFSQRHPGGPVDYGEGAMFDDLREGGQPAIFSGYSRHGAAVRIRVSAPERPPIADPPGPGFVRFTVVDRRIAFSAWEGVGSRIRVELGSPFEAQDRASLRPDDVLEESDPAAGTYTWTVRPDPQGQPQGPRVIGAYLLHAGAVHGGQQRDVQNHLCGGRTYRVGWVLTEPVLCPAQAPALAPPTFQPRPGALPPAYREEDIDEIPPPGVGPEAPPPAGPEIAPVV